MAKFKLEDGSEVEAFTPEELENEVSGLKNKISELLGETKNERENRQALEQAQAEIEEQRAKEKGEFKSLYEKTLSDLEREREQARGFAQKVQQKELEASAQQIATQLTRDSKRAEVLKKEAMQFAQYTEEGVKFSIGGVDVPTDKVIEHLRSEYPFLADGKGSTGGGASGGFNGSGATSTGDFGGDRKSRQAAIKAKFNLE